MLNNLYTSLSSDNNSKTIHFLRSEMLIGPDCETIDIKINVHNNWYCIGAVLWNKLFHLNLISLFCSHIRCICTPLHGTSLCCCCSVFAFFICFFFRSFFSSSTVTVNSTNVYVAVDIFAHPANRESLRHTQVWHNEKDFCVIQFSSQRCLFIFWQLISA